VRRSLTLDFLRGFAIWMMIIFHTFQNSWDDLQQINTVDYYLTLPFYYLIPLFLLAYLSSWAGLFLIISTTVNVISTHRKIEKGIPLSRIRRRQVQTGVLLLILAYLAESLTVYTGFIGYAFHSGSFSDYGLIRGFMDWRTLHIISFSLITTSIYLSMLYRQDGYLKLKRNLLVTAILALCFVILTPVIEQVIQQHIYSWWAEGDPEQQYIIPSSLSAFALKFFLIAINGHLEPIFPFFASALIGVMFGMVLSQDQPPKTFPRYAMAGGVAVLLSSLMLFAFGNGLQPPFLFHRNTAWFLMGLGGQICSLALLLWLVEFRGNTDWFKNRTTFWRRWGMSALTIYCLQTLDIPLRLLLHLITGLDSHVKGGLSFEYTVLLSILTFLWWDLILRIWAEFDYKFSLEWIMVHITSRTSAGTTRRTDLREVVYDVEPIEYY
jgi:uncharacterized membrane protein